MDLTYLLTPFFAWLVAGVTKFIVNCAREKRLAFDLIGYGGMPSNHSAIVSSVAAIVALREGIEHPAFVVALGLAFVVMLDANSLRRQVGRHAEQINLLNRRVEIESLVLRERMGHSRLEILAGILVGCLSAWVLNALALTW
ncbi:MAG: divergent PAP2 family protein [Gammaproteobacteria bacterium]|nr:divergent PAP2 family protein [Gammaproteobacteria bacterium]MBD3776499.1 divergent PAP2 family protein [Thiotrichales bacterium]